MTAALLCSVRKRTPVRAITDTVRFTVSPISNSVEIEEIHLCLKPEVRAQLPCGGGVQFQADLIES
jgi:hypothetical protein